MAHLPLVRGFSSDGDFMIAATERLGNCVGGGLRTSDTWKEATRVDQCIHLASRRRPRMWWAGCRQRSRPELPSPAGTESARDILWASVETSTRRAQHLIFMCICPAAPFIAVRYASADVSMNVNAGASPPLIVELCLKLKSTRSSDPYGFCRTALHELGNVQYEVNSQ